MPVQNGDGSWDDDEFDVPEETPSPDNVSATPGLGTSSDAPANTEPHQAADEEIVEEEEPLPEFDPKYRQDFEGLLFIGKLTDTFTWAGHSFVIKTLTTGEILEIGLLHAKYAQTLADLKAYQAAAVAACIVSVDGKPLSVPLTNEVDDTELLNKFQYIQQSWFSPVLDVVYQKFLELEARVETVIEAMGKASG